MALLEKLQNLCQDYYCYLGQWIQLEVNPHLISKRSIYLIFVILGCISRNAQSQTASLQGEINQYAAVETILAYAENDVDSVIVTNLPIEFEEGDTVMLYCVQGAEIMDTEDADAGDIDKIQLSPGKYAFLIIDEIAGGNTVVFNTTLHNPGSTKPPVISPLKPGETAQLIRVPSYRKAEVVGKVTAPAWDGTKGGVVALFVTTTLTLSDDIDVSGKGFRGAEEDRDYNGSCSSSDTVLYDSAFYHADHPNIKAGLKGESVTDTLFAYTRGKARNINGGGGGNGKLSGGGGGSNYFGGGKGGDESSACGPGVDAPGGTGGLPFYRFGTSYYQNFDEVLELYWALNRWNRIFFGGGGGTGTRIPGKTTTPGGRGGGLVVIIADTIAANGGRIIADGESVVDEAEGAGGGGGGGGGIILDVSGYKNNVQLSAVGGDGGNTNDDDFDTDLSGPGGGGGGGIYWLAGASEPGVSPDLVSVGKNGVHLPSGERHGALNGGSAARKNGLEAPLQGFLFNSVPTEFWACSNLVPETINASQPKGGDGLYRYTWVDSSSTQNTWLPVGPGDTLQNLYFDAPLSDTTYFRRIVRSGLLKPDTSFRIAMYVHQALTNNLVTSDDEICQGNTPQPFVPQGVPANGDGAYAYRWVVHEGDGQFVDAPGTNDLPGYSAPDLQTTSYFSRIVSSGACADTTVPLEVNVLLPLSGLDISPLADTICKNTAPAELTGNIPTGGKDGDKRYLWESSLSGTGGWNSEGVSTKDYQPAALSETTWFRRMVYSGLGVAGDACVDSSNTVRILNIEPITENTIVTAEQTVCTGVQPLLLQGSNPGGGYQGTYSYRWESRTLSTTWGDANIDNPIDEKNYQPVEVSGDTTWYRRVVGSGGGSLDVCTDASAPVAVNVLPLITNNEVLADDVKCQFDQLGDLEQNPAGGTEPGGGATQGGSDPTRNYKWEVATSQGAPEAGWAQVSYGFDKRDYTDHPRLTDADDYWYRRIVFSGPILGGQEQVCSDTSDLIRITIHTAITDNEIDDVDSACFNSDELVQGKLPLGEPGLEPAYLWRDMLTGSPLPGSDSQDYTHLFDQAGPYEFSREVTIGECEDTSNTMTITVMDLPGGILSADLPETCEKDTLFDMVLNMDTLTNYITPWAIYLDDGVNAELDGPYMVNGSGQIQVTLETHNDAPSTTYTYTPGRIVYTSPTGSFECEAPSQNMKGIIPIEVFNKPNPKITVDGLEMDLDSICGESIALVVDPDHGEGYWSHDPDMYMSYDPDPTAFQVTAAIPQSKEAWAVEKYTVQFYSEAGDCHGTDQIELHFFEQPEPAYAGKDTTIFLKNSLKMNADSATAGYGIWSLVPGQGNGQIEDINDPKTFIYDLDKNGDNAFSWTVINGNCTSTEHVSVVTHKEVLRYEGFSPNEDGINDVFIMRGLADPEYQPGDVPRIRFTITFFNNLGRTIREITQDNVGEVDYDPTSIPGGLMPDELVVWDGKVNGNVVTSGTYYYVLEVEIDQVDDEGNITQTDAPEPYKGYVVVQE